MNSDFIECSQYLMRSIRREQHRILNPGDNMERVLEIINMTMVDVVITTHEVCGTDPKELLQKLQMKEIMES